MTITVGATKRKVRDDGQHRTKVKVTFGDGTERKLWFDTAPEIPFVETNAADIWMPIMLLTAMGRGEDLEFVEPFSERSEALDRIQDIMTTWFPKDLRHVSIHGPDEKTGARGRRGLRRRQSNQGTASFFTLGVDSFHTFGKNRDELDALLYVFGFDVPLKKVSAVKRVRAMLEDVSTESGKHLLTARTNTKEFVRENALWGAMSHGAALVSTATVFSTVIDRILVPASHTYLVSFPWGSHPLLDPLWSTERLQVVHDGAEADRVEKLRQIADDPIAQRHLRVCYAQYSKTNCCRCMKCLRTMAMLTSIDALDRFPSFHEPLDLELMRTKALKTDNDFTQIQWLYDSASTSAEHRDVTDTAAALLEEYRDQQGATAM